MFYKGPIKALLFGGYSTRSAPTSYKWGFHPYKVAFIYEIAGVMSHL